MKHSIFQKNFFHELLHTRNNIMLKAVAGSGKTTTIVEAMEYIPKDEPCIFISFNNDIVEELAKRIKRPNVSVSTIHSFGCRMLMTHYGGVKIVENKAYIIALKLYEKYSQGSKENRNSYAYRVSRLVDMARLTLTDINDKDAVELMAVRYGIDILHNEIEGAQLTLEASTKESNERIDFADMLYIPVIKKLKLRKYKYVFVDEAQDCNAVQHEIIKNIIHPKGGRLIVVGDPMQSIYGFAGADTKSFDKLAKLLPNTVELPLSICYRCPAGVVKLAQTIVPEITANPAREDDSTPTVATAKDIRQNDWVLCRNTRPLVCLFVLLVMDGRNAFIKGREIGQNLINLIKRTKATSIPDLIAQMNQDRLDLKIKLIKRRVYKPDQSQQMMEYDEKFRVVKLLGSLNDTVKGLIKHIESIFLDEKQGAICLSTIHKAKGSEADRVFLLCPELIPSKYAKTPEDFQQEEHLKYVAYTRAKKELFFINGFDLAEIEKQIKEMY